MRGNGKLLWFLLFMLVWCLGSLACGEAQAQTGRHGQTPAAGPPGVAVPAPLSLKDCIGKALKTNPSLAESYLGVQAAAKGVDSARSNHLPRLFLDSNYTQRQDPWPYIPAQSNIIGPHFSDNFASWTVLMSLPIYKGGQIANGVELARLRKTLQEENQALNRNEIIANTVNTYNKLLQLQKLHEASQASVAALENQVKDSRLLFKVGRIAKADLLKVEVQLANERQRLLSIEEGLANLSGTLHFLMGESLGGPAAIPVLTDRLALHEFTADFQQGLAAAKKNRPEYRMAVTGIQEAEINRRLARGKLFPSLHAYAGYLDQYGFNPGYQEANWFTFFNLSMPLFEKSLYDDLSREKILEEKAGKRLQSADNQLRLDLQTSISSLMESKSRVLTAQKVIEHAQESFRIEEKKYASGAGAVVDLLFAQSAYVTAVANHSQALFDYNAAIVSYRKVTGTLEEYLQ